MAARRARVVVLAGPRSLSGLDERLRRAGLSVSRLRSVERSAVPPARWLSRLLASTRPDTVLVLSAFAVEAGVVPWRRAGGDPHRRAEYWAAGPTTAGRLRRAGCRPVCTTAGLGAGPILENWSGGPRRRILYFRSSRSGTSTSRRLRRDGHRVADPIVYRVEGGRPLNAAARRRLGAARAVLVSSPTGVRFLRRRLPPGEFARLVGRVTCLVLGERSRRAALSCGFVRVERVSSSHAQRLTEAVVSAARHAEG